MVYSGGCQCGNIRYAITHEPITAYCCHCTACQQQSSSAFGVSVWFPAQAFTVIQGTLSVRKSRTQKREKQFAFCPDCGCRIYHASADAPETFSVKGGSLDQIREITPIGHIWTRSAQPWVRKLLNGDWCHDTEPDSFDVLIDLFERSRKA